MIRDLILNIISSLVLCSACVLSLPSCCKLQDKRGILQPEWETRIPTGTSKSVFYHGLRVLPKYKDWIIAHTTIYDGGFNLEDNRLCAVNLKTGLVDWYFPENTDERHYCDFDAKSYRYKNKLVFQYQKDARTYQSRDRHTTCCLNLDTKEVLWEEERDSERGIVINMDIIGKEQLCYFVKDDYSVSCVDLTTDEQKVIYKSDSLKINYLSLAENDRLLLFSYIEDGSWDYRTYIKILNLKTNEIEYFRKLTPENANHNITVIPAKGFEKNGILYTALDTYTAAIDVKEDKLLWGRQDYGTYNAKEHLFEDSGVLLKCGINATLGYNAKTGEVFYNYDNYGSHYATQQGKYAYLLTTDTLIDVIDIKSGRKLDFIKCKYENKGESFFGSYPTLIDGKMYVMSYNHLFRYPTYPW